MIRHLQGIIFEKVRNQIIVDVHGVGYAVFVTPASIAQATIGTEALFHVAESIREDAHDLYGFLAAEERDQFELLRKVSGVGPKVALAVVGFFSPHEFSQILQSGDAERLSLVPGIGKKVASKIVLELKGKNTPLHIAEQGADDTIAALEALGYSRIEIATLLPKVPTDLASSQEKITWLLRHLGG
jgi:Holliday junction DNA helicase RuvA